MAKQFMFPDVGEGITEGEIDREGKILNIEKFKKLDR